MQICLNRTVGASSRGGSVWHLSSSDRWTLIPAAGQSWYSNHLYSTWYVQQKIHKKLTGAIKSNRCVMWTVFKKEKKNSVNWDFGVVAIGQIVVPRCRPEAHLSSSPWTSKPTSKLVKYCILSHREHIFPVTCNTCSETRMRRGSSCAAQYPPPLSLLHRTSDWSRGGTSSGSHLCTLLLTCRAGYVMVSTDIFHQKGRSKELRVFLSSYFLQYLNTFFGVVVGGGWWSWTGLERSSKPGEEVRGPPPKPCSHENQSGASVWCELRIKGTRQRATAGRNGNMGRD